MLDFNNINQISQIKSELGRLKDMHSDVSSKLSEQVDSVKSTASQMVNGFSLYGFKEGILSAFELAQSSIKGLTEPKDFGEISLDKILKTPEIANNLQARIDNKGSEIPLVNASIENIKSSVESILPYTPHPQHYYKDNANRVMKESQTVGSVEGDNTQVTAVRSGNVDSLSSISQVVENATKITEDLKNIQVLQNQIASVSANLSTAISTIDTDPFQFLSTTADQLKQTIFSYVHTYDSVLSPMSEAASSKFFRDKVTEEKNPDNLKKRINYNPIVPSMPGNLFYLAHGNNLQENNPDLYNKIQQLRQDTQNANKSDYDLFNTLMPMYAIPGYNSLPYELKQKLEDMLDINKIIENPEDDLSSFIPAMSLRSSESYNKFKKFKEIDSALGELSEETCYEILSIAIQYQQQESNLKLWLLKLKMVSSRFNSLEDALNLLFMDRNSNSSSSTLYSIWDWIFNVSPSYGSLSSEMILALNGSSDYFSHLEKSEAFVSNVLPAVKNEFGSLQNVVNLTNGWKDTVQERGGFLGFQAFPALLSALVLERIKLVSSASIISSEEKESIIKKLAEAGSKYSAYLLNGTNIKTGFDFLRKFGA